MKQQKIQTGDQIVKNQHFTLLELLDRLLDKGVVVKGEILLSVADIDLVYLNLGLLLSSVKSVEQAANREAKVTSWQTAIQEECLTQTVSKASAKEVDKYINGDKSEIEAIARALPTAVDHKMEHYFAPKATIDPKNVEKGLIRLVLTLVDLIRKLMEKQAIRRIDSEQLTTEEVEKMGDTFLLLDEKMEQLKKIFALKEEDLNLDLGPLGELF